MNTVLQFPPNVENAHFDAFLKEHNDDPDLPLLVYYHLCEMLNLPRHDLGCVYHRTYEKIEGAVNGLLDRAYQQGVIDNDHRLVMRRVQ